MSRIEGCTALVTGGASGIGRLTGARLLEAGAERLVVWDVDEAALGGVVEEHTARGHRVDAFHVDIADLARVRAAVREMRERSITVDLLVNNAGIIVGRPFSQHSHEDVERTMAINALAPMYIALELLPEMLARGRGHIVNVASAAGMVSNPGMSVYCASKWAVIGWSDSLRLEMERAGTGVRVTTVTPYYVDTGMFEGVRSRFLPILRRERVARAMVEAIRSDRIFLRLPAPVNLLPLVRGLLPTRWFDRVVGEWGGVYDTMRTFRGRQ